MTPERHGPLRRFYRSFPRLRRRVRAAKNALVFRLVQLAMASMRPLSLERALALADRVGGWIALVARRDVRLAREHLALAFGDSLTPPARDRLVRACFRNVARSFVEVAKFDRIRPQLDAYVSVDGWEHVQAALDDGRGIVVVTGHIGNWELLAAYFGLKGIPVAAIARRIYNPRLNDLIVDFRRVNGVQTILRESPSASREILGVLRNKGVLALLIDQDTKAPSVSVPLFGRPARTPAAAAALALRSNVPVLAAFAQRRPGGGHRLTVLPPIPVTPTGDRRRDIVALTRRFNEVLEARIRANPAEWVWWHRRWRRGPAPRLDLDAETQ